MQSPTIITSNYITVVACQPQLPINTATVIEVSALQFWHNRQIHHAVTEYNVKMFLLHTAIFGAIIFPDKPQWGCLAINAGWLMQNGEAHVWQISYHGAVIYTRS